MTPAQAIGAAKSPRKQKQKIYGRTVNVVMAIAEGVEGSYANTHLVPERVPGQFVMFDNASFHPIAHNSPH